jgi:hypothetical protein
MTNAKAVRKTQNTQKKPAQNRTPAAAAGQQRRRRGNANAKAAVGRAQVQARGDRFVVTEVITVVEGTSAEGVFQLVPTRTTAKDGAPRGTFDLTTGLGQQALMYGRMQYVVPPKLEWIPTSTQTEGMVSLGFRTHSTAVWATIQDAVSDYSRGEAVVGTVDKPRTMSVPLSRLIDIGQPSAIDASQGYFIWKVAAGRDDSARGSIPVGFLRLTATVLLSERAAPAQLAELFGKCQVQSVNPPIRRNA